MKKWLDALKGETFTMETFDYFLEAFQSFLTRNPSADSMRSLALYITYAIHKSRQTESYPTRGKSVKLNSNVSSRRQTLSSASPRSTNQQDESAPHLSQLQVALRILKLYADILCHKQETANIKKFARTVTSKVSHRSRNCLAFCLRSLVASSSPRRRRVNGSRVGG